jgi:hypothetical protein
MASSAKPPKPNPVFWLETIAKRLNSQIRGETGASFP